MENINEDYEYSGIQLMYSYINQKKLEFNNTNEKCHICGGKLTSNSEEKLLTDSWTSENKCENKKTLKVCTACDWITTGLNFNQSLYLNDGTGRNMFYIYSRNKTIKATPNELLKFIEEKTIQLPFIIILKDPGIPKTHTELRANYAITYDYNNIKVVMNGYTVWKDFLTVNGITQFKGEEFTNLCNELIKISKEFILPTLPEKSKGKALIITKKLCKEMKKNNNFTAEGYLAAIIVGAIVGGEKVDKENTN